MNLEYVKNEDESWKECALRWYSEVDKLTFKENIHELVCIKPNEGLDSLFNKNSDNKTKRKND